MIDIVRVLLIFNRYVKLKKKKEDKYFKILFSLVVPFVEDLKLKGSKYLGKNLYTLI